MKFIRYLFIFILFLAMVLPSNSQSIKPDFAFPQTVDRQAQTDLKQAVKNKDAHAALNALVRSTVAQCLIDNAGLQTTIKQTEEVAKNFEDSPIAGLFYSLLATQYYGAYQQDRWRYDRRDIPLAPLPADITEWSGAQYKACIAQLCEKSCQNPDALVKLKIEDYSDLINTDQTTILYYPTLLDFVCSVSSEMCNDIDQDNKQYYDKALTYATAYNHPGSIVLWRSKLCSLDTNTTKALENAYNKYRNNEYASLLLNELCERVNYSDEYETVVENDLSEYEEEEANQPDTLQQLKIERQKHLIEEIDGFLAKFPRAPFANNLKNHIAGWKNPSVNASTDRFIPLGTPFDIKIQNHNANNVTIRIYEVPAADVSRSIEYKKLSNYKVVHEFNLNAPLQAPFLTYDTICTTINKPGYYVAVPEIGQRKDNATFDIFQCIPVLPFSINGCSRTMMGVVDPATGAPIAGANVHYTYQTRGKNVTNNHSATTDIMGLADVTNQTADNYWYQNTLTIKTGDVSTVFTDINSRINEGIGEGTNTRATVLTDRALYHPGEEVNILAVIDQTVSNNGKILSKKVLSNVNLTLEIQNPNWDTIKTIEATTDDWGRVVCSFTLPTEGLTGNYSIRAYDPSHIMIGNNQVMVSDYKLPDFEIVDLMVMRDTPLIGNVTVKGQAKYYSGMPMANAEIDVTLSTASFWRWFSPDEKIYSTQIQTQDDGTFSVVFDAKAFENAEEDSFRFFIAKFDAVSPSGTTADASVSFSLGKKYLINLGIANTNVDGLKPFMPSVEVTNEEGKPTTMPMTWLLTNVKKETVASGAYDGKPIDLTKIEPGCYMFTIEPEDPQLADAANCQIVIYNTNTQIVPSSAPLWTPVSKVTAEAGREVKILIGTTAETSYVYYFITESNTLGKIILDKLSKGYHTLSIPVPADFDSGTITLLTVKDCKVTSCNIPLTVSRRTGINIIGESFRDKLIPSSPETWKFRIVDADGKPVQSALALDMYNKALESLATHPFVVTPSMPYYGSYVSIDNPNQRQLFNSATYSLTYLKEDNLSAPAWNFYGYGLGGRTHFYGSAVRSRKMMAVNECYDAAPMASDAQMIERLDLAAGNSNDVLEERVYAEEETATTGIAEAMENPQPETEKVDYRDAEVPLAIWAPALTTDADGNVCYTFQVPNANTTWRLRATAWTQGMECGSLMRDFVASKPIMVQPNIPRFLRAGDKADFAFTILNNSDSACHATTVAEIFNPTTDKVIKTYTYNSDLEAMGSETLYASVEGLADMPAIGFRVRVGNGQFTDGEQTAIPVLPSTAQIIETRPFYLNPGEKEFEMTLPSDPGARISLTFSENPVWTIVSALPGLRELNEKYANSAAASLFSAMVARGIIQDNPKIAEALQQWLDNPSDSALVSMLEKNEDLKIALLNATPWVQAAQSDTERMANLALIFNNKEIDNAVSRAKKILEDLQYSDGGWAWSDWCKESSVWTTSNVLSMMAELKEYNWLPSDKKLSQMISKALEYYDSKMAEYLNKDGKYTDMMYCMVRPRFKDAVAISAQGQKVIENTTKEILKSWKRYSDPAYKSMAAEALYLNGYAKSSKELMSSVSEFGVWSKDQGLRFPSVNAIWDYAIILGAYARIEPNSKEIDGLRQQLIVRKQATDWGSSVVTNEVVASILSTGSCWTVDAQGASVTAGGQQIVPQTAIESATGSFRADLSDNVGQELIITTSGVGPAYGAVYAQFERMMDHVESFACDDLSIEKVMMVRRGTEWEYATDSLKVGDRVKIQLTIHNKRNMQYVSIIDERPAAFEPADQLPGWMWSEGVGFYRENRDSYTTMHVVYMSPGTYLLTYEMNVTVGGTFSSGVATIQSQYAPELSAHSAGQILTTSR